MQDRKLFAERRRKLLQQLPESSVAIFPGADIKFRNNDCDYLFRQDSNFYYLTGYIEPDAVLVLYKPDSLQDNWVDILFNLERKIEKEIWTGKRVGQEAAVSEYLFNSAYELSKLQDKLSQLLSVEQIYCRDIDKRHPQLEELLAKRQTHDSNVLVSVMRLFKAKEELDLIRKATDISSAAHTHVMSFARSGMNESELEAEFQYFCHKRGARSQAYIPIVASGNNSCTLHYNENNQILKSGDLVLVDAGCEFDYYAADITRTFPVDKKFTEPQRKIYELVLAAQEAGIEQVIPGNKFSKIQDAIVSVIVDGLLDLGILSGDKQKIIDSKEYRKLYMHSSGHWLGLDVHDAGEYKDRDSTELQPGMLLTVEPGIYIDAENTKVDPKWRGIGIRIEDDILVTETGYENLTASAPKTVAEIEKCRM